MTPATPEYLLSGLKSGRYRIDGNTIEKRCIRCHDYWPADGEFFYTAPSRADGLYEVCKACYSERQRESAARQEATAAIVGLSESTWQALVREGKAPKPRQLSDRRVGWLVRELEEWVEGRPASDLPPPANTGAKKPRTA